MTNTVSACKECGGKGCWNCTGTGINPSSPQTDPTLSPTETPMSISEKYVRKEQDKLNKNTEELKEIKKQVSPTETVEKWEDFWVEIEPHKNMSEACYQINGKWYAPKFGCDSLQMTIDLLSSSLQEAEKRGYWRACKDKDEAIRLSNEEGEARLEKVVQEAKAEERERIISDLQTIRANNPFRKFGRGITKHNAYDHAAVECLIVAQKQARPTLNTKEEK